MTTSMLEKENLWRETRIFHLQSALKRRMIVWNLPFC